MSPSRSAATTPDSPTCSPSAPSRHGPATAPRRSPGAHLHLTTLPAGSARSTPPSGPGTRLEGGRRRLPADLHRRATATRSPCSPRPRRRSTTPSRTCERGDRRPRRAKGFTFVDPTPLHRPRRLLTRPSGSTATRTRSRIPSTPTAPVTPSGYAPGRGHGPHRRAGHGHGLDAAARRGLRRPAGREAAAARGARPAHHAQAVPAPRPHQPAVRAAAARAGVNLSSRASIDAADRRHGALQEAAPASAPDLR